MKLNNILERQIKRKLLNNEQCKDLEDFLQLVSKTYDNFEEDYNLAQRSLEISSKELIKQNAKLKEVNANLEKLAYAAAHDLRTPLLNIKGYLQIIKLKENFNEELSKYFTYVVDGVERMNDLLTNLQRYTEIDFWKLNPEKVDLTLCIEMCMRQLSDKIKTTNTSIWFDELPIVEAENSYIEMIFMELLKNSIAYTKPNINPCIKITAKKKLNKYHISFKDNGMGIEPKYKDYIFEEFKRLHNYSEIRGNGLGLAICKKIIIKLKGEIFIDTSYTDGLKTDIILNNW